MLSALFKPMPLILPPTLRHLCMEAINLRYLYWAYTADLLAQPWLDRICCNYWQKRGL